ncbi:MAG TPA: hypothetical protein VM901_06855 [Bdellovibrionota bacterium]|jgi:hypothetical protein|nr:hypothetical protein [Bdellovibrionota bacterium]
MKAFAIAFLAASTTLAATEKSRGFEMDIPSEWMRLSQGVRQDMVNLGSEEIDFRWNPSGNFFKPLEGFTGPSKLRSAWGSFAGSYTSINLQPKWRHLAIRLRGEISYGVFAAATDARLHDLNFVAGTLFEPHALRWRGDGSLGLFVGALWEQWFAPESRQSLAQAGYGGGLQSGLELRQGLGRFDESDIKAVASLTRRDYFIATPYRGQWLAQIGMAFTL